MLALICVIILLSLFASSVMMYIALATSIGPWVGPLLVLLIPLLLKIFFLRMTTFNQVAAVIGGSIGGILATACAFSLPAIYFVDSVLYNQWLLSPCYFIGSVSLICFLAGAFGIFCADRYEVRFDFEQQGTFPSAHLIFGMLQSADQHVQRLKLLCGGLLYGGFLLFQRLFLFISRSTRFYSLVSGSTIIPMLISIGFVTGHVIAFPLFIGVLIRFICVDGIRLCWWNSCNPLNFSLALCTGIIMQSVLISFYKSIQSFFARNIKQDFYIVYDTFKAIKICNYQYYTILFGLLLVLCALYWFPFFLFFTLYALFTTMIAVYFMIVLAAKTGLAYLGRFATFVMVPAMMIFECSWIYFIILATFVEIAGGVAVDVLSGRKIVQLAGLHDNRVVIIQWFGLLVASIATGFVLWALCSYVQLGSSELAGYKAHARALLLGIKGFDRVPLALGFCVGALCSSFRINTGTLLGGILMPLETAIGLIAGGIIAFFVKNKDVWYPLASGVFAANSLYMILKAFLYYGN